MNTAEMCIREKLILTQNSENEHLTGLYSRDETVSDNGRNEKRIRRPRSSYVKMYLQLRHHRNWPRYARFTEKKIRLSSKFPWFLVYTRDSRSIYLFHLAFSILRLRQQLNQRISRYIFPPRV